MSRPGIEHKIYALLADSEITVATAESCTGGLVAYRITSVAGSSAYFTGSVVAYSNTIKEQVLGVSASTLETRGAVSEECAREMATGIRKLMGTTIGVSTTGIAGPAGGTDRKPVGLIYFACATPLGVSVEEVRWDGDRQRNMEDAAELALQLVLDAAKELLER